MKKTLYVCLGVLCLVVASPVSAAEIVLRETACRLFDSRHIGGLNAGSKISSATIDVKDEDLDDVAFTSGGRSYNAQGGESGCRVSSLAVGASINVIVFQPDSVGNATVWPTGATQPLSTSINSSGALNEVTGLQVTLGTDGQLSLAATITGAHYVIDLAGEIYSTGQTRVLTVSSAPFAPSAVTKGDTLLVGDDATGDWLDHDGELATWNGSSWTFREGADGELVYDASTGTYLRRRAIGAPEWRDINQPNVSVIAAGTVGNYFAGGDVVEFDLGTGYHVSCARPFINPEICLGATGCWSAAGHTLEIFGQVTLLAHEAFPCPVE